MLQATLRFLPEREGATGDGWAVFLGDETEAPVVSYYATITLAQAAIRTAFQSDASVSGYFTQAAQASVLSAEATAVADALAILRTDEGL